MQQHGSDFRGFPQWLPYILTRLLQKPPTLNHQQVVLRKVALRKVFFFLVQGTGKDSQTTTIKTFLPVPVQLQLNTNRKKKQKQDSSLLIISVVLKVELVCYHATQKHTLALKFPFMAMPSGPNREHIYPLVCRSSSHSDFSLGLCWQG